MNIFVLDTNPIVCASLHIDKHVVKMPLETAQILCTVQRLNGFDAPYKSTHANHPCTVWTRESAANYKWLVKLGFALCEEYKHRYGRTHACKAVIESVKHHPDLPDIGITPFALAMPDECKFHNAVKSYRTYYVMYKKEISSYTKRDTPKFML